MTGLALRFVFLNRPYCFEVNVNLASLRCHRGLMVGIVGPRVCVPSLPGAYP